MGWGRCVVWRLLVFLQIELSNHCYMQRIKSLLVIAIMAMFVPSVFAQKLATDEAVRQMYRQAVDLYEKEKYASAQNLFDKLADLFYKNVVYF